MARLLTLGFLALLAVAEVAAVLALVDWLGPFGALVVLALDVFVGVMVIRWAVRGPAKDRGFRLAAGAFIALPGLVLDLVGVVLLIPAVRDWVRTRIMRSTESALRRSGISVVTVTAPGEVIPGTVIIDETVARDGQAPGDAESPRSQGPGASESQSGPRVVRGEIISGEVVDDPTGEPPAAR